MPLYDFQVIEKQSGRVLETVAVNLPIAKRDEVEFRRVTVPQRVAVMGSAPDNPHDLHSVDMRNLHKSEERLGSNFDKIMGRSKKEMRKIWSKPEGKAQAA
jgi:hypothetical protein